MTETPLERVVRDANIQFGEPCIAGTGIRVEVVASRFQAGESVEALSQDYGRSMEDIEAAIRYDRAALEAAPAPVLAEEERTALEVAAMVIDNMRNTDFLQAANAGDFYDKGRIVTRLRSMLGTAERTPSEGAMQDNQKATDAGSDRNLAKCYQEEAIVAQLRNFFGDMQRERAAHEELRRRCYAALTLCKELEPKMDDHTNKHYLIWQAIQALEGKDKL